MPLDKRSRNLDRSVVQAARSARRLCPSLRVSVTNFLMIALFLQALLPMVVDASSRSKYRSKNPKPANSSPPTTSNPPAMPDETIIVYGPHRFDRTGMLTKASDQFTLPSDAFAPFNISVQNGDVGGSGRVLIGTVRLNGFVILTSTNLNL